MTDQRPLAFTTAFGPHPRMQKLDINGVLNKLDGVSPKIKELSKNVSNETCVITDIANAIREIDDKAFSRSTLEKIIGRNNLMDIAWLDHGLKIKRSVCRVVTSGGLGTGFLVNGDYLLTNNHVISSKKEAENASIEFDFELGWNKIPLTVSAFQLDTSRFKTNPDLDYTISKVRGAPSKLFGTIDLGSRASIKAEEHVIVIQHPNGGYKKIALTDNYVYAVFSHLIQYVTDTEPGSSGSPVFDQNWRLVGLHHAGGQLPGPDGKTSFVNEGIAIEYIVRDAADVIGLSDELFEAITGTIRPTLEWLCNTSGSKSDIQSALTMITIHGGNFTDIIGNRVEKDRELGPLGAVILGTAAGALIRHIGKKNENLSSVNSFPIEIDASAKKALQKDVFRNKNETALPWDVYSNVLGSAEKNRTAYTGLAGQISKLEVLPVVVGAFLAGVVAGAKAYDGKF